MPRDLRVSLDPTFNERQGTLLTQWSARSSEEQARLAAAPAAFSNKQEDIDLWSYARARKALAEGLETNLSWTQLMALEALEENSQTFLALATPLASMRTWLVDLASQHLRESPYSTWLWLLRGEVPDGLEPLDRLSIKHWLTLWSQINPNNVLLFSSEIGQALHVLRTLDFAKFLKLVKSIDAPVVLRTLAHQNIDDTQFNFELARSDDALLSSLGAINQLEYLNKLEAYGEALVMQLDPYDMHLEDAEAARAHRNTVTEEIDISLRTLLMNLEGGAAHDRLTGELLAKSSERHYRRRNGVNTMLRSQIAEVIANQLIEDPKREADVAYGLSLAPIHGMEAAEAVAAKLSGTAAVRWHHRLVQHLGSRLLPPSSERLREPRSSETDPLAPRDFATERAYIQQCAKSLLSLSHTSEFDLLVWFKDRFGQLCLLPSDRRLYDKYAKWSAGTSRAALLMLVGTSLLRISSTSPWRDTLAELLGKELASRLGDWNWYHDIGYRMDAATLEHAAVRECGQQLEPELLLESYSRSSNAWTLLAIAGPQAESESFKALPDRLARIIVSDLYLLSADLLLNVMWHVLRLGYWDILEQALHRYQLMNPEGLLAKFSVQVFEGFVLLYKADTSPMEGLACLKIACLDMERAGIKDARIVELYLNALLQRCHHEANDSDLKQKVEGAQAWLKLV